ncbi:M56 family metallopeptidase [Pedobacter sp. Hv1]|uniref:M56 family metallopeptidase n=1 Tax=Pedobacter sp. Hv1 TaxID=1740090 RepID=UPI0006D8D570|nr:M56 family metallopeptidase [Pedobacter sp. Hv1]KQB98945.1 hypothetical protein AQF98_19645 [Pedobacter sp. Hv1]
MPYLFIILFKINLVLVLFAAAYYLILRRLTFYVINRIFLVFGILFSTIYPFIDLTDFFFNQTHVNQETVVKMNQQVTALVPSNLITAYWGWISLLFYIGVVFMAFRLLIQFVSLYKMHQKSAPGSIADYQVRILTEPVSPFSFWQTVYINPSLHKEQELKTILAHENIHVKQWHSLDIILAELSVVFYWFNPGVWLMKRAVKENLEFITDEKILKKGIDKKAYQYSLLDVGTLVPSVPIVNNFNLSDLKKRIKMMNVKRSSRLTLSRYLLVLPVLLLTTLAFTVTKKDIKKHLAPLQQVLIDHHIIDDDKATVEPKKIISKHSPRRKKQAPVEVTIKPDSTHKVTYTMNTIYITTDSTHSKAQTEERIFNAIASVAVANIPARGKFEGKLVFVDTTTTMPRRLMGRVQGGPLTKADKDLIEATNSKEGVVTVIGYGKVTKPVDSLKSGRSLTIVLNGKKVGEEELNKVNPDHIKNVKMVKQEEPKLTEVQVIGRKIKQN